jgi:hypothetical protein
MNEYVRNNRYFKNVREFRHDAMVFWGNTRASISEKMRPRINDNFHLLKKSNFSLWMGILQVYNKKTGKCGHCRQALIEAWFIAAARFSNFYKLLLTKRCVESA